MSSSRREPDSASPGGVSPRPAAVRAAWRWQLLCVVILAPFVGCSGRLAAPSLNPKAAAQDAMTEFDTNHDGYLDAKELERCPGLQAWWKKLQAGGGKTQLSADDIENRITQYRDSRIGLIAVNVKILLDEGPLSGATVTLKPERFLGSSIKPATGTTDASGRAELRIEGSKIDGCQCGFYRVEVSKRTGDMEYIPARYNSQTVLGLEVGPVVRGNVGDVFRLTSN